MNVNKFYSSSIFRVTLHARVGARRPQNSSNVFTTLVTIFLDDVVQEPHKQLITMAALRVDDKNEGQLSLSSLSSPQSETDDGPSGRGQC